ncbi:response regulator [Arthrobacter castelli]|uniref:response regulator n=1 Tax=Arthrobacter castelli TaxID=271431 RepID=UPI0003F7F5E8|nr:response regulator transcription factor [Arthrobacter castelli]
MTEEQIRILIVDDQEMVRAGFSALLDAQPDLKVVASVPDGRDAVGAVKMHQPDIVLMDIRMPQVNGLDATRQIFAMPGNSPSVIMLTTFDLDDYVFEALRAGASGFLLKDAPADDLIEAVRIVSRGDALLAPSITKTLIAEYIRQPARSTPKSPQVRELTDREREVVQLVARGMSNAEIAVDLFVTEQTVKSHVSRTLGKLGLRDRAQIVVFAYESGLTSTGA